MSREHSSLTGDINDHSNKCQQTKNLSNFLPRTKANPSSPLLVRPLNAANVFITLKALTLTVCRAKYKVPPATSHRQYVINAGQDSRAEPSRAACYALLTPSHSGGGMSFSPLVERGNEYIFFRIWALIRGLCKQTAGFCHKRELNGGRSDIPFLFVHPIWVAGCRIPERVEH